MNTFQELSARVGSWLRPAPPRAPLTLEVAWSRVLPKVRPWPTYQRFSRLDPARAPEVQDLGGDFGQSLVLVFSNAEVEVTSAHLRAWGQDFQGLMNQARINLLKLGEADRFRRSRFGFYQSTWGDELDGSRILLPGVLRQLPLSGAPVVFLPRRDVLLVAGSEDPDGLGAACEGALQLRDSGPEGWPCAPMCLNGFRWEPLQWAESHPAGPALVRARGRRLAAEPIPSRSAGPCSVSPATSSVA
jgi:hypothetical protein